SKIPYGRSMAQEKINELLIDRARAGAFVVRLKGGDPYLFGRGYEELQALTEAQVPVTVVPGVPSALSVPAAADIPVTHRGVTHELTIVSGHLAPDHPDSLVDWPALAAMNGTLAIMMGVAKLAAFTEALIAGGRDPQTPAAMISDGTTDRQRTVRADLAGLAAAAAEAGMAPPAITVIGPVAGLTPQGCTVPQDRRPGRTPPGRVFSARPGSVRSRRRSPAPDRPSRRARRARPDRAGRSRRGPA